MKQFLKFYYNRLDKVKKKLLGKIMRLLVTNSLNSSLGDKEAFKKGGVLGAEPAMMIETIGTQGGGKEMEEIKVVIGNNTQDGLKRDMGLTIDPMGISKWIREKGDAKDNGEELDDKYSRGH